MNQFQFILYVSDQSRSREFYKTLLQLEPTLDVPGMTEFQLTENTTLGIMPEKGIAKILSDNMPPPESGNGIPRCEIYLYPKDIAEFYNRAIASGAKEISPIQERDWGDKVGYLCDFDGHIIAFAKKI